jgi:GntR family transcriptional regulator
MLEGKPGKPLHSQVRDSLTQRIASGQWPPGSRLPGEMELCSLFGVSRITIRQALQVLEADGLIERQRGRGTTVKARPFEQRLSGMYSFSEELQRIGAKPTSTVLGFALESASDVVASRLAIAPGAPVLAVKRLRLAVQEPFAVECSYIPAALAGDFSREDVEQHGLYGALQHSAGITPQRAEETFGAEALPPQHAALLQVKKNAPAMLVERVAVWEGVAVEYCVSWIRADKFRFKVTLNPAGLSSGAQISVPADMQYHSLE